MSSINLRMRRRLAAIVAALAIALWTQGGEALMQRLAPQIENAGPRQAVLAVAEYTSHRGLIDQLLGQAGYLPSAPGWSGYPTLRKLETAYLAAEGARAGNGAMLLAQLARGVSDEYGSAAMHPALAPLIRQASQPRIDFTKIVAVPPSWRPPSQVQAQIQAISYYAEGGGIGGPQAILRHHFELPDDQVYDILRTSNTTAEAIERGLAYVPEAERHPRLVRLARDITEAYPNARRDGRLGAMLGTTVAAHEPVLRTAPVRQPGTSDGLTPPPASRTWTPPSPGPGPIAPAGGSGVVAPPSQIAKERSGVAAAATRFKAAESSWFRDAAEMVFQSAVGNVRGPGGIMFGDRVVADSRLPQLVGVGWLQPSGSRVGSLEFVFASGPPRVVTGLRADHVLGALRLLYSGVANVSPKKDGEAISLISLEQRIDTNICDVSKTRERTEWQVVVHPAIADLEVGHELLGADVLPTDATNAHLLASIEKRVGRADRQRLEQLMKEGVYNWKLTDVPTEIVPSGTSLIVRRAAPIPGEPTLATPALFTMHGFTDNDDGDEILIGGFADRFYPLVPSLMKASREFESMNGFIQTMALLRWARMQGAPVNGMPVVPPMAIVPAAIVMNASGYSPVAPSPNRTARTVTLLKQQLNRYPNAPVAEYLKAQDAVFEAELLDEGVADAQATLDRIRKSTPAPLDCLADVRSDLDDLVAKLRR
jgi:hypothetical protein